MSMTPAWSHLPNAVHIDRILASAKAHPDFWYSARDQAWYAARDRAWLATADAARDLAWDQSWDSMQSAAQDARWNTSPPVTWGMAMVAQGVGWGAIAALVAWDHSAQYLSLPSDQLEVWAVLSSDPACILLFPAVRAFEQIAKLEVA